MERPADAPTRASEPDGFRSHRAGDCRLVVAKDWEPEVLGLGLLKAGGCARLLQAADGPRGRAATAVVPLDSRAERLHLRAIRHGGWLAPLWGERLLGNRRVRSELAVNAALRAAGAPVPTPVLASAERVSGPFWTAAIATVHEMESADGIALLASRPDPERARLAIASAARAIRAFHDAGGRHLDLHVGNLLFRSDASCLVIDLDRARLRARVGPSARMAELMRLYRSLVRRGLLEALGPDPCRLFLDAYTDGDTELRRALLRHLPRERLRLALHRLAWS